MFGQIKTGIFLKFANHDKNGINTFVLKIQDVSSNKIVIYSLYYFKILRYPGRDLIIFIILLVRTP